MKKSLFLILIFFSAIILAQVGIGNNNPRGLLDVNDNLNESTMGLVVPIKNDVKSFIDPSKNNAVSTQVGTIGYDTTLDCLRVIRKSGSWSGCFAEEIITREVDCSQSNITGQATVGVNSTLFYKIFIKNNTDSSMNISGFSSSDISFPNGDKSLSVSSIDKSSLTIAANSVGNITYTIKGTPDSIGEVSILFSKDTDLICSKKINISPSTSCNSSNTLSPAINTNTTLLSNGTVFSGEYKIKYNSGDGVTKYPSISYESNGITMTRVAGVYQNGGGEIVYNVTGSLQDNKLPVVFTLEEGCKVYWAWEKTISLRSTNFSGCNGGGTGSSDKRRSGPQNVGTFTNLIPGKYNLSVFGGVRARGKVYDGTPTKALYGDFGINNSVNAYTHQLLGFSNRGPGEYEGSKGGLRKNATVNVSGSFYNVNIVTEGAYSLGSSGGNDRWAGCAANFTGGTARIILLP